MKFILTITSAYCGNDEERISVFKKYSFEYDEEYEEYKRYSLVPVEINNAEDIKNILKDFGEKKAVVIFPDEDLGLGSCIWECPDEYKHFPCLEIYNDWRE